MDLLRSDENTEPNISGEAEPWIFSGGFNIGSVNTKIFVLMLASMKPRSLISGARVDLKDALLRCNRNEFHHIFPKAFLQKLDLRFDWINSVANFCFLSASDNQKIKDKSPAEYIKLIPSNDREKIFEKALLRDRWYSQGFEIFFCQRVDDLVVKAAALSGLEPHRIKFTQIYAKVIPEK